MFRVMFHRFCLVNVGNSDLIEHTNTRNKSNLSIGQTEISQKFYLK